MAEKFVDIFPPVGYDPLSPRRTMNGAPAWRSMSNFRFEDGEARARPALRSPGGDFIASIFKNGTGNEQMPLWIWSGTISREATTRIGIPAEQHAMIVVTTREIWLSLNGTWSNVTPTYTTGTVTATNGSPTVTGAGTLWLTRHIAPTSTITIQGVPYIVSTVDAEGQVTLTSNYTGATAAGKAYAIYRNIGGTIAADNRNKIVATVFNGALYVAGTTLIGNPAFNAATTECGGPGVLRLDNIFDSGGPTATYLMARHDVVAGIATYDGVAGADDRLLDILGMSILQDGRVVLATHEMPRAIYTGARTGFVGNRIRYSSHLDQTVWTVTPGGFFDIVGHSSRSLTALGTIQGSLTAHFEDAITLLRTTGQDDPPLSVSNTTGCPGAISSRVLANDALGRELFLDNEGRLQAFDGQGVVPFSSVAEDLFRYANQVSTRAAFHSFYETREGTYHLFVPTIGTTAWSTKCYAVTRDGLGAVWDFSDALTAATELRGDVGSTALQCSYANPVVLGVPTYLSGPAAANTEVLCNFGYNNHDDSFHQCASSPATIATPYLLSDVLSPDGPGLDYAVSSVAIWLRHDGQGTTNTYQVKVYGTTSTDLLGTSYGTKNITLPDTVIHVRGQDMMVNFTGQAPPDEAFFFEILAGAVDPTTQRVTGGWPITRVRVFYNVVGDTRTVQRATWT